MYTQADIDKLKKKRYEAEAEVLIPALEKRQYEVYYCDNAEEACRKALELIPEKASVSWGGTVTCDQIGLIDKVKSGPYKVIDRADASSREETLDIMRKALTADYYLTSFNAVSLDGIVFNIDGNGNRVAAITFGPKYVIAVVGMNKVCRTDDGALMRAEEVASQLNAARFNREDTLFTDEDVTDDCQNPASICNVIQQLVFCGNPRRIKVILVGEDLGF